MSALHAWLVERASPLPQHPPRWQLLAFWAVSLITILYLKGT